MCDYEEKPQLRFSFISMGTIHRKQFFYESFPSYAISAIGYHGDCYTKQSILFASPIIGINAFIILPPPEYVTGLKENKCPKNNIEMSKFADSCTIWMNIK